MPEEKDLFTSTVVPIMNKVRHELSLKQADEYKRHSTSFGALITGAVGPDGGMAARDAYNSRLYHVGEWNSKTVEDYIDMVKTALKKEDIAIDSVLEKKMIDYLVKQQMPKSASEYILRKAAEGTLFYIPQRIRTSSLQDHVNKEGEKQCHPSLASEATANLLSWATNATSTGGIGGFIGQTILDISVEGSSRMASGQQKNFLAKERELGQKEIAAASKRKVTIPQWMLTQTGFEHIGNATDKQLIIASRWAKSNADIYRKKVETALANGTRTVTSSGKNEAMSVSDATFRAMQYQAFAHAIDKEQNTRKKTKMGMETVSTDIAEADKQTITAPESARHAVITQQEETVPQSANNPRVSTGNYSGWGNLLDSLGLTGYGDIFHHLGLTLATLPDMLIGIFTGRTRSIGRNKSTMMPLAALIGGSFIKNPLLKIPFLLYGGANLISKAGHEALSEYKQRNEPIRPAFYRRYADEELNPRICNPHVEGNVLIVDIDHIPRIVTMPSALTDAYRSGAIPLHTLANHVLAKTDQMKQGNASQSQDASRKYEQGQEREQVRGIR